MGLKKWLRGKSAPSVRPVPDQQLPDLAAADQAIIEQVRPYTMTSEARLEALLAATDYVLDAGIDGAFVECGVWRGGSMMAVILRLLERGVTDRDIYLYDTFEGMTEPTKEDVSDYSPAALETWQQAQGSNEKAWDGFFNAEVFNEDSVRERLQATGYPAQRLHFVKGKVEDSVPQTLPPQTAVLRLDTDWYTSTQHEMQYLYPLLVSGGVVIIDDYGHWKGCRQAVDEYFAQPEHCQPLLHRVDYTCRQGIKP